MFIFAIPLNISDDPDFGLLAIGGLQLLDEFGDENDLAIEFSPNNKEEVIEGCFGCSCEFIWELGESIIEDISMIKVDSSGL